MANPNWTVKWNDHYLDAYMYSTPQHYKTELIAKYMDDFKVPQPKKLTLNTKDNTMKLQAYRYIVLSHPTDSTKEDTTIILEPGTILAKNEETAKLKVAQMLPKEADMNKAEIIIELF